MSDTSSDHGFDDVARNRAFAELARMSMPSTPIVHYHSDGRLLILAEDQAHGEALCSCVSGTLKPVLLVIDPDATACFELELMCVGRKTDVDLSGHLGDFVLAIRRETTSPPATSSPPRRFDLVMDALSRPLMSAERKPPGYYAVGAESMPNPAVLDEINALVGDFEKPQYYTYDPDICAHGRNGQSGCTRCLDACPAEAITSLSEKIAVNEKLCQGFGVCASACPTGAIAFNYPATADIHNRLKTLLSTYREAGGSHPQLLLIDQETAASLQIGEEGDWYLPTGILPIVLEEQGSLGLDTWLYALACGAASVAMLFSRSVPTSVQEELSTQIAVARRLMGALGYPENTIAALQPADITATGLNGVASMPAIAEAAFAIQDNKRLRITLSIDHLASQATVVPERVDLPDGAAFGRLDINTQGCTLCMSCVSVCPAKALADGGDVPALKFYQTNCVQCGLCESACPESVLTRVPEFVFDQELRRRTQVLNEEQPYHCIRCNKPFATYSMIQRITGQLAAHSMFQAPGALERLKMCEDCRVIAMMQDELE